MTDIIAIRCALLVRGLSQADLAWKANISPSRLSHILCGRNLRPPDSREKAEIARVLGYAVGILFPPRGHEKAALVHIFEIQEKDLSLAIPLRERLSPAPTLSEAIPA